MTAALGERAPGFELPATSGETHGPEAGPPATVVYWTANHCGYANRWLGRLHDVARDYSDRGVRVLAIASNDASRYPADGIEEMTKRVERENWPHPYLRDESQEVAREWGVERTPEVFVLDSDLRLRYHGAPDADHEDASQNAAWLRGALDAVLDGREPEPAETDPVGCSIKWRE